MCRWLAYTGSSIPLEALLFNASHSLIDQSMSSRAVEAPTNGDGFGVGWYGRRATPGLFRSIRPAWNDHNLRDLAAHIEAPLFLAHVRAASRAAVEESNCHPFRFRKWLFMHNGAIDQIDRVRRDLLLAVSPSLFPAIGGTTDSELLFYLALTFGLETDPIASLERMAGFVEKTASAHGAADALSMTLGLSDGRTMYVVRYAGRGEAPTLYHSRDMEDLHRLDPHLHDRVSRETRIVVSEPVGNKVRAWQEIPPATAITVQHGNVSLRRFHPTAPA